MSKKEDALSCLFDEMVNALRAKIREGKATAQDFKNVIQLLRDNGITCSVKKGTPLDFLTKDLPFETDFYEN